jgi:two-component system nitrogen regulation response regulator GlnG
VRTAAELSPEEVEASWRRHGGDPEAMVDELRVSREGILRRLRELGLSPAGRFGRRSEGD